MDYFTLHQLLDMSKSQLKTGQEDDMDLGASGISVYSKHKKID
jgi:hypothetical protein